MLFTMVLIAVISILIGIVVLNNDNEKSFTLSDWRFIESKRDRINGDSIIHKYYIKIPFIIFLKSNHLLLLKQQLNILVRVLQ